MLAENGQVAVELIKKLEGQCDLILMDIQMPVLDGYEATKQILALYPNIPIVACTTVADCLNIEPRFREVLIKGGNEKPSSQKIKPSNKKDLIAVLKKLGFSLKNKKK